MHGELTAKGVLKGGKSLVAKETMTIADLLKKKDHHTVMIGKWHLEMKFDSVTNHKKGAIKPEAIVSEDPIDKGE